jgi:hypothetical protein
MNKERLLDLAKRLREVPPSQFQSSWKQGSRHCVFSLLSTWYPEDWTFCSRTPTEPITGWYGGHGGCFAFEKYFGLDAKLAERLISTSSSLVMVAGRIEEFVAAASSH